jgi:hypothetical protein
MPGSGRTVTPPMNARTNSFRPSMFALAKSRGRSLSAVPDADDQVFGFTAVQVFINVDDLHADLPERVSQMPGLV